MSSRAALTAIAPWVRVMIAVDERQQADVEGAGLLEVARVDGGDHRGVPVGGDVADDARRRRSAPTASHGRLSASSPL